MQLEVLFYPFDNCLPKAVLFTGIQLKAVCLYKLNSRSLSHSVTKKNNFFFYTIRLTANKYKLTLTNCMVDGAVNGCLGEKDDSFTVHRSVWHRPAKP